MSPLQVSCHLRLRPSPAICHWEDVWIWFKCSWQLSTHLRSACSKTFIPISSFRASNSWELWNFGKKTIQWLHLLWKINSFYESKNVYVSLVESILISDITCNLKARNKTLTRVGKNQLNNLQNHIQAYNQKVFLLYIFFLMWNDACSAQNNYESD